MEIQVGMCLTSKLVRQVIESTGASRAVSQVYTLVFFEAVARYGSFTKAADELHVTQSAVSKQVKHLEEALGFKLFDRQHRSVVLTAAGTDLLESTQPLIQALESTIARIRQRRNERAVTIICTQAVGHYWLFPRLVRFHKDHPDITVNVTSTNDLTDRTCMGYDFGILYGHANWPSLEAAKVFDEQIYPICSVNFDAPEIEDPRQILQLPLVQLNPETWKWSNWKDYFAHFEVTFRPPKNTFICNQLTLAMNAAANGVGAALSWDYIAKDMIDTGLVRPLGPFVYITGLSDYLVHTRGKPLSPASQVFKDWLLTTLGEV
jgi:LysR family transcriptional regulator, glycine cleavage system transcriptional activator